MSHSCVENYLHVIFSSKNRIPNIPIEMEERLFAYLGGIAKKNKSPILKINGTNDHIHMLLKLHPDVALSKLLRELKSYSTGWMKKEGYFNFSWQLGYGGFSCSVTHVVPLTRYIENQKIHHQKHSFDEELEILNKKWGTSWKIEKF